MNILITGGCGFIGSNFINYYYNNTKGVNIVCLDAMYYCASYDNINKDIYASSRYTHIDGNLCDFNLVKKILIDHKITHIVHFAAQSHVDNSFNESFKYTQDNVVGTHNLLESIKQVNAEFKRDIFLLHFII